MACGSSSPAPTWRLALRARVGLRRRRRYPPDLVACGEVGLGGELRQVGQTPRRLAEAARLGFRRAVVPALRARRAAGIGVLRAATLAEAIRLPACCTGLTGAIDVERGRSHRPGAPLRAVA